MLISEFLIEIKYRVNFAVASRIQPKPFAMEIPEMKRIGIFGWGTVAPKSPDIRTFEKNLQKATNWLKPFSGFGPCHFLVGAPEFEFSVAPTMLWPPDHKMVEITPSWTVSDDCDAAPQVSLVGIVANEGDDTIGDFCKFFCRFHFTCFSAAYGCEYKKYSRKHFSYVFHYHVPFNSRKKCLPRKKDRTH